MELRNCIKCGKLFIYTNNPYCPDCRASDEKDFRMVKDYLYDNPGKSLKEISEATDVSPDRILKYLREGRLEVAGEEESSFLKCERCGKGIKSGRYCNKCSLEIKNELLNSFNIKKPAKNVKNDIKTEKGRLYIEERLKNND